MYAIEIDGVSKTFKGFLGRKKVEALKGVSLKVSKGEIFGLIGLNGAGKTTLIKSFLSIMNPDGGEIKLFGMDPASLEAKRRVGYLPERLSLPAFYTPYSFLKTVAAIKRLKNPKREVDRVVERLDLGGISSKKMGKFSKGMKQRVGMAAALIGSPELFVFDEPTDGIDPLRRREIRKIVLEERERGATIFINSHLLTETEKICDTIGILSNGEIVKSGKLSALLHVENSWKVAFERVDQSGESYLTNMGFLRAGENLYEFNGNSQDLNSKFSGFYENGLVVTSLNSQKSELEEILAASVDKGV